MSKLNVNFQIPYPAIIEKPFVYFVLRRRKKKFGKAFRKIKLAKGFYTLVDPEDYQSLSACHWRLRESKRGQFYAAAIENGQIVCMHRIIMDAPVGMVVHHKDGNGLNNTKSNLEVITMTQNNRCCRKTTKPKSSKYKGVAFIKARNKFHARIVYNGNTKFLGYFKNEDDAARAYDEAAKIYHGQYAALNFPPQTPDRSDGLSRQQLELLRLECLT
ncbi:MAG: HNH endonuclease [Phycisphaerae bacterium]|nr:HNH endonuclease [Phycisphaerae bacterium]